MTVSRQSPVVDVQNVVKQRLISTEELENLPSAKSIQSVAALIPGMTAGLSNHDVGDQEIDEIIGDILVPVSQLREAHRRSGNRAARARGGR